MADTKAEETKTESKRYSLKEVADHKDRNSAWVVIHDEVYDVTPFLDEHPGGEEVLLEQAGKVATEAFEDVGHSTDARTEMKRFRIGELTDEDKKHTKSKGPMQWSSSDSSSQSSWISWLLPLAVGLGAAWFYRSYSES